MVEEMEVFAPVTESELAKVRSTMTFRTGPNWDQWFRVLSVRKDLMLVLHPEAPPMSIGLASVVGKVPADARTNRMLRQEATQ